MTMMELILLPLGAVTGWLIGRNANTDTRTAMLALVIAVAIAVTIWLPPLQAVMGGSGLSVGLLLVRRRKV
jgi:hypothetical protein